MTKHLSEGERRAQILRASRLVFVEKGYLAARVQDIARRAGLSKGAVYFYFASKHDLFMALVAEEHKNTYSFLEAADADPRPAVVKLLDLGRKYLDYFAGLKSPPRFFLMMTEMAVRDDEIRSEVQAVHKRFIGAAARILRQGMDEGSVRRGDPEVMALMLKAVIDGLAGQSAIGIRPDQERILDGGIQFVLHGIVASQPQGAR